MNPHDLTRRDVLKISAFGATALALPLSISVQAARASELPDRLMPRPYARQAAFVAPSVLERAAVEQIAGGEARDVYTMTMREFGAQLVPGFTTTMWGYNGQFPGPTVRSTRHRKIRLRHVNDLPVRHPVFGYEPGTSVHLHGGGSLPQYDGYANDITRPGQYKDYLYDNEEPGRTAWYHDHVVHHTAENVAMGLAGQYHMTDPEEDELGLPSGAFERPLIINDIALTAQGQLLFDDRGHSGPMGDVILVNGVPWPAMPVEPRKYRFRMLNASIARGFRFRLYPGVPFTVIGGDAGLAHIPVVTAELRMSMGERYDVVIDFASFRGRRVELRNLGVDNSIDFDDTDKIVAFDVLDRDPNPSNNGPVRSPLGALTPVLQLTPTGATPVRRMAFNRQGGEWTINNGETWKDVEESGFQRVLANPGVGDVEIWEFVNKSGGWFHPIHLHQNDWRVLSRNGRAPFPYESATAKDTVYLGENDVIQVIQEFGPHEGRYMFHCHNNSHEDHDMMAQYRIGRDVNSPFSAPARGTPKAG